LACELPVRALPAAPVRLALPAGPSAAESAGSVGEPAACSDRSAAQPLELPRLSTGGAGLARWDAVEIARELVARGVVDTVSASTVRRWLAADALKPWRYRSWIFPRDKDFAVKGGRVLDLYQRVWDGRQLTDDEYVVSADEKTSIQPRPRRHDTLPAGPHRPVRVEHEYRRAGALAYFAGYDVHRAQVIGRAEQSTGIAAFHRFTDQLMATEPYASARTVYLVVDNGSSHRGQAAIDRMADWYPNVVLVHTPVHASWLNQVEIYFSIVTKKVVPFTDLADVEAMAAQLVAFEQRFNATATGFDWKFTRDDLNDLLRRLAAHDARTPKLPAAA